MWEWPVRRQRRAGRLEGGGWGWAGEPTHHHLLPLAFRAKSSRWEWVGQRWGSDLVQQGTLAVEQPLRSPVAPEEEDRQAHGQHQEEQQHGQHHGGRAHGPAALLVHLNDDHLRLLLSPLVWLAPRRAAHPVPQCGLGVARLHLQLLVVEFPVFVPLVEVSEDFITAHERPSGRLGDAFPHFDVLGVLAVHCPELLVESVVLVSPEEVGLSIGHPEESRIDLVSGKPSAQLLDVLGVARLQGSLVKHPVLISFEEDEFAILPLIGSVDGRRQAPPELADGHWVAVHHLVVPHPPEPAFLEDKHLPSEHGHGVKVPVTDIGPVGGVPGLIGDRSPGGCPGWRRHLCGEPRLAPVKLLDAPAVIIRQHEVLCVHPLVKRCHDG